MTEWALPTGRLVEFENLRHRLEHEGRWQEFAPFVRGGYWRNFKVKYPETNEMYARMQMVSRRLQDAAIATGTNGELRTGRLSDQSLVDQARTELYRGQCNCAYWHGAFGGAYLPHLRNAIYQHLIAADNLLDEAEGRGLAEGDRPWVELTSGDYNLDGRQEVRLASNRLHRAGGAGAGRADVRARRPLDLPQPARHAHPPRRGVSSQGPRGRIGRQRRRRQHPRPRRLQAARARPAAADTIATAQEPGRPFLSRSMRRSRRLRPAIITSSAISSAGSLKPSCVAARIECRCSWCATDTRAITHVRITKGVTLEAGDDTLADRLPARRTAAGRDAPFRRRVELCRLPAGADDRYFRDGDGQSARPTRHAARSRPTSTPWASPTAGWESTST